MIFHRWLPNGEKDAVKLNTNDPNINLKVWFERCGFTKGAFIQYNEKHREVDSKIMTSQGCLYSGPLFGMLEIDNLPPEEIQAIRVSKEGDQIYINLTKRLVENIIYQPVSEFIDIIKINFGQFWIKPLPKYDSRHYSLGYYSSQILNLQWSLEDRKSWKIIDPDAPDTVKATFQALPRPDYLQFMTKEDWESIYEFKYSNRSPNHFLIRSHSLCEGGDLRLALIEGTTALELSIHEFIRNRASSRSLIEASEAFYNLPLRTQLTILCSSFKSIPQEQIEHSIEAINLRNKIVHEGIEPKDQTKSLLYALLKTVSYISGEEVLKFPSKRFSMFSTPDENWPKYYK